MVHARPLRVMEARKLPGLQLFRAYPSLSINDILLQEFYAETETSEELALGRWQRVVKNLIPICLPCAQDGTLGEQTLNILENIHKAHSVWYKGKNKDHPRARILQIYPDNTPPAECQPAAKSPPYLIGIGSYASGSLSLSCYIDSEPFFTESDPIKAMVLLIAAFFIGHIKWPPLTRLPLLLLTCALVGPAKVYRDIAKNHKLVDVLKNLGACD